MSETPRSESKPSPWLSLALPLVVSVVTATASFAVQWGTLGADVRHLGRAHDETRTMCLSTQTAQAAQAAKSAIVETELAGMRREMERMSRALERLADGPSVRR